MYQISAMDYSMSENYWRSKKTENVAKKSWSGSYYQWNYETEEKEGLQKKHFWVHPLFQLRHIYGFYEAIFPTLSLHGDKFQNYLRITTIQFEELLCLVGSLISKQNAIREPIPAAARLAMTLRLVFQSNFNVLLSIVYII